MIARSGGLGLDLKETEALGGDVGRHWYYAAKARMLAASVEPVDCVLDVGAGSGFFSRWLLREGLAKRAICVDPFYAVDHDETEAGRPIQFRRKVEACEADLLLLMDVMEHVDDDQGLLSHYMSMLRPGGRCFITVPAFQSLWSAHDVFLEHKRRYTLKQIESVVAASGGRDVSGHYYYGAVLPLAYLVRRLRRDATPDRSDLSLQPAPVNAMLSAICRLERLVMRSNRLGGLSVAVSCCAPQAQAA